MRALSAVLFCSLLHVCTGSTQPAPPVEPPTPDAGMAAIVANAYARVTRGETVDFAAIRDDLVAHLKVHPDTPYSSFHLYELVRLSEMEKPGSAEAMWRHFESHPIEEIRNFARGKLRVYELREKAWDLAFTAADGRRVDLREMRGKVVLVDFWATWCGPCVAELPHLQELHRRYGPAGLEIVGIAMESRGTRKTATAEERERKRAAEREKMLSFVRQRGIEWPQFCDGLGFESPLAREFSLNEIPMVLLLGRDGRLVGLNLRGEALEREIARLLKS